MGSSASRARSGTASRLGYTHGRNQQPLAAERDATDVRAPKRPQGQFQQRSPEQLPADSQEDMKKDLEMGKFLDQLQGSIANRPAQELAAKEGIVGLPRFRNRQEDGSHRLGLPFLKSLLEDSRRARSQGTDSQMSIQALAESYGVSADLLEKVLMFNAAPLYREKEDGRVYGTWQ